MDRAAAAALTRQGERGACQPGPRCTRRASAWPNAGRAGKSPATSDHLARVWEGWSQRLPATHGASHGRPSSRLWLSARVPPLPLTRKPNQGSPAFPRSTGDGVTPHHAKRPSVSVNKGTRRSRSDSVTRAMDSPARDKGPSHSGLSREHSPRGAHVHAHVGRRRSVYCKASAHTALAAAGPTGCRGVGNCGRREPGVVQVRRRAGSGPGKGQRF